MFWGVRRGAIDALPRNNAGLEIALTIGSGINRSLALWWRGPCVYQHSLQLGPREARLRLVLRHEGADVEFAVGPTVEAPADARSERIVDGREVGPWRLIHRLIPET